MMNIFNLKNKRIWVAGMMLAFVLTTGCSAETTYNKSKAVKDRGRATFHEMDVFDLVNDMRNGWNLGNTMDATGGKGLGSETSWSQPHTTKEMIDNLAKSGIKTLRIPTSWSNHIIDKDYSIDPAWMARVKEIVDWAIADDMYVILNIHHDNYTGPQHMPYGKGFYPNYENQEESLKFITNTWAQISLAFNKGYGEKLVFELLNEPRLRGTNLEWYNDKNDNMYYDAADVLQSFNQAALDTIRASGGNNAKRYVMVSGLCASPESALADEFSMPKDKVEGHLILSVHMYSPYSFAMQTPGEVHFTNVHKSQLTNTFNQLEAKFVYAGYPVVIGEYGATNKNNLEDRVEWFKYFNTTAREYGFVAVLWDNGDRRADPNNGEKFGYYNRNKGTWYFPEILDAIVESTK